MFLCSGSRSGSRSGSNNSNTNDTVTTRHKLNIPTLTFEDGDNGDDNEDDDNGDDGDYEEEDGIESISSENFESKHEVYHGRISKKDQQQARRPITRAVARKGDALLGETACISAPNSKSKSTKTTGRKKQTARKSRKKTAASKKTTPKNTFAPSGPKLVTTVGAPIHYTRQALSTMHSTLQIDTFGCIVYCNGYKIHYGSYREFAQDEMALPNSFNSFNATWLRKVDASTSSLTGTKRTLADGENPASKKSKTVQSSDADTASVAGSTRSLAKKFPQFVGTTVSMQWHFRLLVPPKNFLKTELLFYELPKIYSIRIGKFTNKYRLRAYVPGGKQCWFTTVDSIKTPYGGDLNFDFRFVNFTGNAKYPDTAEWPIEKQGKTSKSYTTYSAGIHRYAVLIRNHYRGTGDESISEYMCYLKSIGLRSLKYYIADLFY